jgi:hypothetical protein
VSEHPLFLDRSLYLTLEEEDEATAAECSVVMADLNLCLLATTFAFHHSAPAFPSRELAGREY